MQKGQPFLSLRDATLRLYDRTLFEHTDWQILDDQHWAVVGPNGSGKSTLMKALCGHVPVVQGQLRYHFAELPDSEGAYVAYPQVGIEYVTFEMAHSMFGLETAFHQARWNSSVRAEALPVSEYLSKRGVLQRNPYERLRTLSDPADFVARQRKIVQTLDIENLLDRELVALSNGEMRKVRIAHALMKCPRLLILDNPFAGLDSAYRERLSSIVERLMQEDLRVIVVTTRLDEIPSGITHILVIEKHQCVAQGPRREILTSPTARKIFASESTFFTKRRPPLHPQPTPLECPVLVDMEDLHVVYGEKPILRGINWTIHHGEHWALLGPNGSGKTTLLSLILRDNPQAYANRIALFGRNRNSASSIWEIKRHIGWVSPELHLYYPKHSHCLDVVCSGFLDSVGLHQRCSSEQRQFAEQWLDYLGLLDQAGSRLLELSHGQQRLVLIARALVKSPLLLILDEPCHGLDAMNRARVLEVVEFAGRHLDTSIIYVTHRVEELPSILTHQLVLDQGTAVQRGKLALEKVGIDMSR